MNSSELAYKLKYILQELGMNKTEFLTECRKFSPSMSKPTILNAFNGKNTTLPTIETISTIVKVCQNSNNKKLKCISYDFLLNDNIQDIEAKNAQIYQEIGISDEVIKRLKQYNNPIYFDFSNIINYFFIYTPSNYFKYLKYLKITLDIKRELNKEKQDVKKIMKLFNDFRYQGYIKQNFKSLYEIYIFMKNTKSIKDIEEMKILIKIVSDHFKYLLLETNRKLYENMEEI